MKYSYKNVYQLSEAPIEDALTEEEIAFYLADDSKDYSVYKVGDIVFVDNYLYADKTKGINHLFVIVDKRNTIVSLEYFSMIISSNNENNLNKDSIVKTDHIYKIPITSVKRKIGSVSLEDVNYYLELNKKES